MPYYDYRCPECGPFDRRRPLSESALPSDCPKCGKESPRMLSAPHVAGSSSGGSDFVPSCGGAGNGFGGGCGGGGCGHMH